MITAIDLEPIVNEKKICVLLTCKKPQYVERVNQREYIYTMIQRNGFIFFYLYSDPDQSEDYVVEYNSTTRRYSLTVKTDEHWNALGLKMDKCYSFFNQYNIKGILKIDDDVDIDVEYEELIFSPKFFEFDYAGAIETRIECLKMKREDSEDDTIVILEIPNKMISYFGGPFYWVSKSAIKQVVMRGPVTPCEDVNVGYAMTLWDECKKKNTHWRMNEVVKWD